MAKVTTSAATEDQLRALQLMREGASITGQLDEVQGHLRALTFAKLVRKIGGAGRDAVYYRTKAGNAACGYPAATRAVCTACDLPHKRPNRKRGAVLCGAMLCIGCVSGKECEGRMPPWSHQREFRGPDGKVPCPGRQALTVTMVCVLLRHMPCWK